MVRDWRTTLRLLVSWVSSKELCSSFPECRMKKERIARHGDGTENECQDDKSLSTLNGRLQRNMNLHCYQMQQHLCQRRRFNSCHNILQAGRIFQRLPASASSWPRRFVMPAYKKASLFFLYTTSTLQLSQCLFPFLHQWKSLSNALIRSPPCLLPITQLPAIGIITTILSSISIINPTFQCSIKFTSHDKSTSLFNHAATLPLGKMNSKCITISNVYDSGSVRCAGNGLQLLNDSVGPN